MSSEDVGMARRRHGSNPVAAWQRKVFIQSVGLTLLLGWPVFMIYLAVTST